MATHTHTHTTSRLKCQGLPLKSVKRDSTGPLRVAWEAESERVTLKETQQESLKKIHESAQNRKSQL